MRYYFFFLGFIFFSCKSINTRHIYGKYKYVSEIGNRQLILYENQRFDFFQNFVMDNSKSEGNWEIVNNYLILNSDYLYKTDYMEVDEAKDSIVHQITIIDENNFPLNDVIIYIDDKKYWSDSNGIILLPDVTAIKTIKVIFAGLSNNIYKLKDSEKTKNVIIKIIPNDRGKTYFFNKECELYKNLILIEEKKYVRE